jgi:hypothetical protein
MFPADSVASTELAVHNYLDVLASAFVITAFQPWYENIGKLQIKSPRVYVTDSGLMHALLNIRDGTELDLLAIRGRHRVGFEIDRTTSPALTPSMRSALTDLKLSRLFVVHAGQLSFDLAHNVYAVPPTALKSIKLAGIKQ